MERAVRRLQAERVSECGRWPTVDSFCHVWPGFLTQLKSCGLLVDNFSLYSKTRRSTPPYGRGRTPYLLLTYRLVVLVSR